MLMATIAMWGMIALHAAAITPSPQMIEQFKALPKSEQQRLAKQYGVDPSILSSGSRTTTIQNPEVVAPRKATNNVVDQSESEGLNQATKTKSSVEALESKKEKQLKRFGYDLFAGEPTTFAPVSDVPVPSEYMVGPGDTLNVQLYGKEHNEFTLTINREGVVQFPDLGPISLNGLTFAEVREVLKRRIDQAMIGIQASITMGELRSIRIFVAGDAYKPGSYTVSSLSTMTQALFVSGGVNQIGSLRNIQLKRMGKTVGTLDLYDLLMKGDASGDMRLQSGDVVFIPPSGGSVGIKGEIRRPAIYELKNNETIADVLRMASGLKPGAYPKASSIERYKLAANKTVITIDLTTKSGLSSRVKNGDIISVKSSSSRIDNVVTISGAVIRPGEYQWSPNLKVADILPSIWGDLTISADLDYCLLVREINRRGDIEVQTVALGQAITKRSSKQNIVLQPRDHIVVFDYSDRKKLLAPIIAKLKKQSRFGDAVKTVNIGGNVKFPGQYPLTKKAKAKDLLIAAGGLQEGAYTLAAELTRQLASKNGVKSQHTQISLEDIINNVSAANVELQSRDIITVRTLPDFQETRWVKVQGEVVFPGSYSIQRGETLKQVLERAGGLTEEASARSAVFLRKSVQRKEQIELSKLSDELRRDIAARALTKDGAIIGFADAQLMLNELENVKTVGRLVVDINAINMGIVDANIDLENEDEIYIPAKNPTVSVMGQVQYPSTHRYKQGLKLEDYLNLAGGPRKRADDDRVYVLKADGSVMMPSSSLWYSDNHPIEPGDSIIMPLDTEYKDSLTLWSQVTQIIYNTAVAISAISSI
ncbi:SLBB domain-containing protein [Shewanella gelidii]|nr:SLBB domain-containing protein [Shewanella gelidii]MCL1096432.1 SLBB domain-containing protein [Shewanella gelidii]